MPGGLLGGRRGGPPFARPPPPYPPPACHHAPLCQVYWVNYTGGEPSSLKKGLCPLAGGDRARWRRCVCGHVPPLHPSPLASKGTCTVLDHSVTPAPLADTEFFAAIPPSGWWSVDTYASHPWRVLDSQTGEVLQEVVAGQGASLVRVGPLAEAAVRWAPAGCRLLAAQLPDMCRSGTLRPSSAAIQGLPPPSARTGFPPCLLAPGPHPLPRPALRPRLRAGTAWAAARPSTSPPR